MKLESDGVWGISKNHLQILEAAEKLTNVREYMLISTLKNKSNVQANFHELALDLVRLKFLTYKDKMYKLSLSGHDCLAINALRARGLQAMGSNIGIGKESDIYYGIYNNKKVAVKIHRLGRTSFQRVDERNLLNNENWFSINKENARKEVNFMKIFSDLEIPRLVDSNRHVVVMELSKYEMLYKVKIDNPKIISEKVFNFIYKIWKLGYVHGDLNEFNIMVRGDEILVLDFPQCVSAGDVKAAYYMKRDVECIHKYFWKKNFYTCDHSVLNEVLQELSIEIEVTRK